VRKPPKLSSSGSRGLSTERMPTSSLEEPGEKLLREIDCVVGGNEAVSVRAWEMVSKFKSTYEAALRNRARVWHCVGFDMATGSQRFSKTYSSSVYRSGRGA
jgi:hypothetical protein